MKIFMVVNHTRDSEVLGMAKKITSQIKTMRKLGHEVIYTAYLEDGVAIYDNNDDLIEKKIFPIHNKKIFRYARMFYLTDFAKAHLKKNRYDLGYIRWTGIGSKTIKLLKQMRKSCKQTVMDTHGHFKGQKPTKNIIGWYLAITSSRNEEKIHGLIDLVIAESKAEEMFGAKVMTYDNGVTVGNYTPHNYTGREDELNLITVVNESAFHGLDRIIYSISNYSDDNLTVKLHLVGKISNQTKKVIEENNSNGSIIVYGEKYGKELDEIFDQCNVAVGPVAPHRTGGKEGTGLKTKEYFARGIPYFFAGSELLVPNDYPYIYCIPSDESLINFEQVWAFYSKIKNRNIVKDMREYAKKTFSWEKVYNQMFEILNSRN